MRRPCREILAHHAGAVECRRNRASGTTITLYRAAEAGMEDDPEFPWATVCEDHNMLVLHPTRSLARQGMAWPEWCEECQAIMAAKGL